MARCSFGRRLALASHHAQPGPRGLADATLSECHAGSYILYGWTIGRSSGMALTASISAQTTRSEASHQRRSRRSFRDPSRVEVYLAERHAYQVVGRTAAARWLVVIWIDQPEGRYPIHARAASKRIIRRLTQ